MTASEHIAAADLHGYLDRELSSDARAAVETHLEGCASCRRELETIRQVFLQLEAVGEVPLGRDLSGAVVARLRRRRAVSAGLRWVVALEVLVAGALLGVGAMLRIGGSPFPLPSLGRIETLSIWLGAEEALTAWIRGAQEMAASWITEGLSQLAQLPLSGIESHVPWLPVLGVALLIWVLGNGLLLAREGGHLGEISGSHGPRNGANHG